MPGYDIIRDIIATFPDVNPRWWFSIDEEMIVNEDHQHYGICKECLKKDGKIELLLEELMKRDKIIAELRKKIPDVSGQESQAAS